MNQRAAPVDTPDFTEHFREVLKSQYHAALAMLRQAIERCPDALWASRDYHNPFWRIAYHVLYYTHLYIQPALADFRPWEHHQTGLQFMDDTVAPPEIQDLTELPHRPPQTGEPYTKAQMLEYWSICERMVDDAVDVLDLTSPESGFSWYKLSKAEHQFINIRHIQHHAAQLGDRVRATTGTGVDWVSAGRRAES